MADYLVTDTELTSVADAIRTKGGTSANLSFPTEFVSAINAIATGKQVASGTYTAPSSDVTSGTVILTTIADLGFTPSAIIFRQRTSGSFGTGYIQVSMIFPYDNNNYYFFYFGAGGNGSGPVATMATGNARVGISDGKVLFTATSNAKLKAGQAYYWYMIGE